MSFTSTGPVEVEGSPPAADKRGTKPVGPQVEPEILAETRGTRQPLLLYVRWLGKGSDRESSARRQACETFELGALAEEATARETDHFLCADVDAAEESNAPLLKQYKVTNVPAILLFSPDGHLMARVSTPGISAAALIQTLEQVRLKVEAAENK